MDINILIGGIVVAIVVCFSGIFIIRMAYIAHTEGAVSRLSKEIAATTTKQAELSRKLKEADDELNKKKEEAKQLANKMRTDAEEASAAEREKIIGKAREEAEEIIAKAQGARETIRQEIQKEESIKVVEKASEILNKIFSEKSKTALDKILIEEFMEKFKTVDMSRISPDIAAVEVVSVTTLDESIKTQISKVVKEKLGRELKINAATDPNISGGLVVKFGSMTLDGSLKNFINEEGTLMREEIEKV